MQLAKSVKFRTERFGAVLFHTESERVFTLNPTAAAIVSEIKPGRDEAAVAAAVKSRFRDTDDRIEGDVYGLLESLTAQGLVETGAS